MARGRCAGCGHEDVSSVKVRRHIAGCEKYATLYRENPAACLDPEEEMIRWKDIRSEIKEEARADKADRWREFQERRAEQAQERWASAARSQDGRGIPLSAEEVADLSGATLWGRAASQLAEEEPESMTPAQRVSRMAFLGEA